MNAIPPLRNLGITPVEHEGEQLFCMNDPEGLSDGQVMLSGPAFFIAACLDGSTTVPDIQQAFSREFGGVAVPQEQIMEVIDFLDQQGLLYNQHFFKLQKEVESQFLEAPTRPAYLAGKSYPENPTELRDYLDHLFEPDKAGEANQPTKPGTLPLPGLIVPHIDFDRGRDSYRRGYSRLAAHRAPKTVFIFGVAHNGVPAPFILTKKSFETPFGTLKTQLDFIESLEQACSWDPCQYESIHRTEHSIEFQTTLLAYLFGTDITIVPILCSQFSNDPLCTSPETLAPVQQFLTACARLHQKSPETISVIAGADLAHVGPRFGDPFEINDSIIKQVEVRDREDLEHLQDNAPERFYASVMKDQNARKVCGLAAIYAASKMLQTAVSGAELLHYGYADDPLGGIVSFSALTIT